MSVSLPAATTLLGSWPRTPRWPPAALRSTVNRPPAVGTSRPPATAATAVAVPGATSPAPGRKPVQRRLPVAASSADERHAVLGGHGHLPDAAVDGGGPQQHPRRRLGVHVQRTREAGGVAGDQLRRCDAQRRGEGKPLADRAGPRAGGEQRAVGGGVDARAFADDDAAGERRRRPVSCVQSPAVHTDRPVEADSATARQAPVT